MQIINYHIKTSMGELSSFGDRLPFLSEVELKNFNHIGYSGKTVDGVPMDRATYLNSLRPNEQFKLEQTRWDSGDFSEEFMLTRVVLEVGSPEGV